MKQRIRQLTYTVTIIVMSYIPFHAFISTWLISSFGHPIIFKSLKDVLVFAAFGLLAISAYLLKIKFSINRRLLLLIALYFSINAIYLIFGDAKLAQKLAGFDVNLRFLSLFIITYFFGKHYAQTEHLKIVLKIVVLGLIAVSLFGLLQSTLLPKDFLSHFGYDGKTIPSYFTIDGVGGLLRYSSTLRGPNVLGAYLVTTVPILVSFWIFIRKGLLHRYQILFTGTLLSAFATLYFTYSRSAWIGLVIALITYLFFVFKKYKIQMFVFAALVGLVGLVFIAPNRNTYFVQQIIFHTDPGEQSGVNSDDQRLQSLQAGIAGIKNNITGHGIGSAGTPSTYGDNPTIVENYFLDIAYQFGILGLILILLIYLYTIKLLWLIRENWIAVSLISSMLGLVAASLFWPVWSDETVAYIWWGMAGIVLGKFSEKKLKLR